jgi:hypothetical protein
VFNRSTRFVEHFRDFLAGSNACRAIDFGTPCALFTRFFVERSRDFVRPHFAARQSNERGGEMETHVADKMLVGAREAAAMLSICPKSLWNFTAPRGTIPSLTIGARRLYDPRDLREWIESQKGGA